ncbi:MAG: hypothetical protein JWR48_3121 [Mycobacterium sp.]|nr:hypothetical protein [Mycobacterium sp.]
MRASPGPDLGNGPILECEGLWARRAAGRQSPSCKCCFPRSAHQSFEAVELSTTSCACRQTRRQTATPGRKPPRPVRSRRGIGPQFVVMKLVH